ncbi:MAG: hypothetical protein L7T26_09260, partial [Pseudomonadales bacterium]|nr:hypothetical protein [Pseudomonadales bacterium]
PWRFDPKDDESKTKSRDEYVGNFLEFTYLYAWNRGDFTWVQALIVWAAFFEGMTDWGNAEEFAAPSTSPDTSKPGKRKEDDRINDSVLSNRVRKKLDMKWSDWQAGHMKDFLLHLHFRQKTDEWATISQLADSLRHNLQKEPAAIQEKLEGWSKDDLRRAYEVIGNLGDDSLRWSDAFDALKVNWNKVDIKWTFPKDCQMTVPDFTPDQWKAFACFIRQEKSDVRTWSRQKIIFNKVEKEEQSLRGGGLFGTSNRDRNFSWTTMKTLEREQATLDCVRAPLKRVMDEMAPPKEKDTFDTIISEASEKADGRCRTHDTTCPVMSKGHNKEWFQNKRTSPNWEFRQHHSDPDWVAIAYDCKVVFQKALIPRKKESYDPPYFFVTLPNGYMYESPSTRYQGISLICNESMFTSYCKENPDMFKEVQQMYSTEIAEVSTGALFNNPYPSTWTAISAKQPAMQ